MFEECPRLEFPPIVPRRFGFEERHENTSVSLLGKLGGHIAHGAEPTESPCMGAASSAGAELDKLDDVVVPRWSEFAVGSRPPSREPEHHEPGAPKHGWQHEAAVCVERRYRDDSLFSRMTALEKAMVRSQAGPNAGVALSRICREAGGVATNMFVRNMDFGAQLSFGVDECPELVAVGARARLVGGVGPGGGRKMVTGGSTFVRSEPEVQCDFTMQACVGECFW